MRILFITDSLPHPPTQGGRQRTNLLLRALREIADVDFFCVEGLRYLNETAAALLRRDYGLIGSAFYPDVAEKWPWQWLQRWDRQRARGWAEQLEPVHKQYTSHPGVVAALSRCCKGAKYDLAVARYIRPLAASQALDRWPVLLDADDMDVEVCQSRLATSGLSALDRWQLNRKLRALRGIIPGLLSRCRHVWVTKAADLASIPHSHASILPNIPYFEASQPEIFDLPMPPASGSQTLLTVAFLHWGPNHEGIDWFLRQAWPEIRRQVPAAEYVIAGKDLPAAYRERWQLVAGVRLLGFVDNLADLYTSCAFTVCPIRRGGGTNIKVVESLAHSRTAVISEFAHRGWEPCFRNRESLFVADSPESFARRCVELLTNPSRRDEMALRGREMARQAFSFDRFRQEVHSAVQQAAA